LEIFAEGVPAIGEGRNKLVHVPLLRVRGESAVMPAGTLVLFIPDLVDEVVSDLFGVLDIRFLIKQVIKVR
jgi:hypothetical protein